MVVILETKSSFLVIQESILIVEQLLEKLLSMNWVRCFHLFKETFNNINKWTIKYYYLLLPYELYIIS